MYYVNVYKQCFVNSVNMQLKTPIVTDYATDKIMQIAFFDKCGKPIKLNSAAKIMIAADTDLNLNTAPCFYSEGVIIGDNVVRFDINTYTVQYLDRVKYQNTNMYIQISMQLNDKTSVLLQDVIFAQPRVYVDGQPPTPVSRYYTKDETDQLLNDIQEQINNIDVDVKPQYVYQSTPRLFYLNNSNGDLAIATPPSSYISCTGSQIQYISTFEWILSPLDNIKLLMSSSYRDNTSTLPNGATLYLTTAQGETIGLRTCQFVNYYDKSLPNNDAEMCYLVFDFSARYTDTPITIKPGDKLWVLFRKNMYLLQDAYALNSADNKLATVLTINYPYVGMNQIFKFSEQVKDIKAYVDAEIANNKPQEKDYSRTQIVSGTQVSTSCPINLTLDQNIIQYFDYAAYNTLGFGFGADSGWRDASVIPLNYTKCFQLWVSPQKDINTITVPSFFNVINLPDSLAALDDSGFRLIHVFTVQVSHIIDTISKKQKWVGSINYNYSFSVRGVNQ